MTASAWKTSAGAAARIPVARTVNLVRQLKAYQEAGCMVVGLAADGERLAARARPLPTASPMGRSCSWSAPRAAASRGWSSETCDQLVSIPMANQLESLNAGVAAVGGPLRDRPGRGPEPVTPCAT